MAKLLSQSETQFHELLLKLLPRMEAKNVEYTHGPDEHGKDIVFYKEDNFGRTYCAVVAKAGDISGASSGKRTLKTLLQTIEYQIESAFKVAYKDVTSEHAEQVQMNEVIVWTTGSISNTAQDRILSSLNSEYRNVRFRDGKQTLALVEKHIPSFFQLDDVNVADYFDKARTKYSSIEEVYSLVSSGSARTLPPNFVSPNLEIVSSSRLKQPKNRHSQKTITLNKFLSLRSNAAILGQMGSGKSTLMRQILMEIITRNQNNMSNFPIPVLLKFRELELSNAKPLDTARESVIESAILSELNATCENDNYTDIFEDLSLGNFTILIDGLDEMDGDGTEAFESAMGITKAFAKRYPKCRLIITSRLELLNQARLFAGLKLYRLEEFTIRQIRQLVVNWFGKNTPDSRKLIQLIDKPITLYSIPHTPLALTIIAVLFQNGRHDLPSNLTELLQKYVELALGRWDQSKNIRNQIEWTYKERILQKLSWSMLCENNFQLSNVDLLEIAERYKYDYASNFQSELLTREILERSGLLIKNEHGLLEFKHRTFLDYFGGKELNSQRNAVEVLVERFGDSNWSRAVFFACGLRPDNDVYLEGIIDKVPSGDVDPLLYAFSMGFVGQAAVHVRRQTKYQIVKRTLTAFADGWNSLASDFLPTAEHETDSSFLPYPFVVLLYCSIVRTSLGSTTLVPALEQISDEILENISNLTDVHDLHKQRFELLIFSLAVACSGAGDAGSFARIMESNIIQNPVYALIADLEADSMRKSDSIDGQERTEIASVSRKLKRKISNNNKLLKQAFNSPPMLLDSKDSELLSTDWQYLLESNTRTFGS